MAIGDVRRAKLYYLREKVGKQARVAERRWGIEDNLVLSEVEAPLLESVMNYVKGNQTKASELL